MPASPSRDAPGRTSSDPKVAAAKDDLRHRVRLARQQPSTPEDDRRRTASALQLSRVHHTVALYGSVGDEPDSWALIDTLFGGGHTVLLPVLGRRADGSVRRDPDWAQYRGPDGLRVGFAGILEPTTAPLGADGLAAAGLIWCSALAATPTGERLGTGGGWYDRALTHADPGATIAVLLRDAEVLDAVPTEPFDRRVDLIVTESRTLWT